MRKLCEIPFSDLSVGDRVLSARGIRGTITTLVPKEQATRQEDNELKVKWDNGDTSLLWHFQGERVYYFGHPLLYQKLFPVTRCDDCILRGPFWDGVRSVVKRMWWTPFAAFALGLIIRNWA